MSLQDMDLLQAARSEDLVYEQIAQLTVLGGFERKVVDTLKQSGSSCSGSERYRKVNANEASRS